MRELLSGGTVVGAICAFAALCAQPAAAAIPSWTAYHRDAQRTGFDPDTAGGSLNAAPPEAWQSPDLDGKVNAEPLLYGSHVYVATENDTIYSLSATTGAVEWKAHVGTPVPASEMPTDPPAPGESCATVAPEGILSTPVIDPAANAIYAVGLTWDGTHASTIQHVMVAVDLSSGNVRQGFPLSVEPNGGGYPNSPTPNGPVYQFQRAALALDGGNVLIGYGSNGDCNYWWGWLVSAPANGAGGVAAERTYHVESGSGHLGGGIWGSGNGPLVDANGNVYVATGNGEGSTTPPFGYRDSVLKLDPDLNLSDSFTPSDWATQDADDLDLGSSQPLPLPGGLLFQGGKTGAGYLLSSASLGGLGGQRFKATICDPQAPGHDPGEIFGGGVYATQTATTGRLYVACHFGLRALDVDTSSAKFTLAAPWNVPTAANGPPIIAAGLVWSVGWGTSHLYGIDPSSGDQVVDIDLGHVEHFATPSAGGGRLFVAAQNPASSKPVVRAYTIGNPASPATSTALASSANPSPAGGKVTFTATVSPTPYAGTVAFTDEGTTLPGCAAVPVATAGTASCSTTYSRAGSHQIGAAYSGDAFYSHSQSPTLSQRVVPASPITGVRLTRSRFRARRGTTLLVELSQPAGITVLATQRVRGRMHAGRCVAHRTQGTSCTKHPVRLRLKFSGSVGENSFVLRTDGLKPGHYALAVGVQGATGAGALPLKLLFMVLAPPKARP